VTSIVQVVDGQELLPGELARRAGVAISALHFYERHMLADHGPGAARL
jgi:hypothetical protein